MSPKKEPGLQLSWTTITYRSVWMTIFLVVLIAGVVAYFAFPGTTRPALARLGVAIGGLFEKLGLVSADDKGIPVGPQQAHFTQIDGSVRVKKVNRGDWVNADYNLPLEKSDVVQTGPEGIAKIVFTDGTNYTVKSDSLIVIEENSTNAAQQTQVAVQVTTGTVDLATATFVQGSKSEVIVAGATASLSPESAAQVRNDPKADSHEILLRRGSGEVRRGDEIVRLADYEKVSFRADSARMNKEKEISPPTLITPPNMMPIFTGGAVKPVTFSWTPVSDARTYHLRVSRNPYFSSTVLDRKVTGTEFGTGGLEEGTYYWLVQSVDARGHESVESERNRFDLVKQAAQDTSIRLEIAELRQHGRVIEVVGQTEPAARVMVNSQEVPVIGRDGGFRFFTPPLPSGENVITVTAQNARGGVNTQIKKVVIQ
ncbi:MAG TPA: hypothetical protein VLE48_08875 [Terriglobales bacterium]|nr:hypothetical protein [Terriglobales bacterium]